MDSVIFRENVVASALPPSPADTSGNSMPELQAEYLEALAYSAIPGANIFSGKLTRITLDNPDLEWAVTAYGPMVKMETWTSYHGYDSKVGQAVTLTREIWTAAVPELKNEVAVFKEQGVADMEMRVKQLLGFPPDKSADRFVEIWVSPNDLFRPALSTDIVSSGSGNSGDILFRAAVSSMAHPEDQAYAIQWMYDSHFTSSTRYPFTDLGYSYDWGSDADHVGVSEFVVRAGAVVIIDGVYTNSQYLS